MHWTRSKLVEKIGTCAVIRRAKNSDNILVAMMKNHAILKVASATLTNLLLHYGGSIRKLTSKNSKVRQLMRLQMVQESVSQQDLDELESKMILIEERRKKKKKKKNTDEQAEEDEDDEGLCLFIFACVISRINQKRLHMCRMV